MSAPGHHPGADRGRPIDPGALGRILVVRADNIGDVVMTTPALRALRVAAAHARIELLTSPAGARVVPLIPELDGVLEVSASWQQLPGPEPDARTGAGEWLLLTELIRRRYDAMIVFTTGTQSPWPAAHLGLLAGIGIRVVHSGEFAGAVATHWVTPPPAGTHQVDRCLHLLAAVGLASPRAPSNLSLDVPEDERRVADELLAVPPGAPVAVLAPGASCAARRYPADRFAAAGASVAAAGLAVRVAGPAAEADLVAAVVAGAGHRDVRAVAPTSVPGFAAVLQRAAVAVTNNSGGMHIADALGTPVAVAWAGTEPHGAMRPRSVPAELLDRTVPCAPCRLLFCPYDHHGCLDVAPHRLAAAALRLATVVDSRSY